VPVIKDVVVEFGPKLKSALESVDWEGLVDSIIRFITFVTDNARAIGLLVGAVVGLTVAYKVGTIAVGVYKGATALLNTTLKSTTTSAKLLRTALFLGGVTLAVGSVIDEYRRLKNVIKDSRAQLSKFDTEAIAVTGAVAKIDPITSAWQRLTFAILGAVAANREFANKPPIPGRTSVLDDYQYNVKTGVPVPDIETLVPDLDIDTGEDTGKVIRAAISETRKAIKSARKEYRKEVKAANKEFADATAEISENYSIAVARASINRDKELTDALKENTRRVADIQAGFAKRLDDIVKQSMQRLRDAYRSAVEINVASIFDGDVVAGSIDGTIEMMRQKLIASRQLLANAASLAAAGFSQTFIEQVVGAGTDVGNELAQSILNATPEQQSEMRTLFNAIETEASSGMDALSETIYEKNGLATEGLKDLYAQTQNELVVALADQEALYQQTMADILVRFDEAVASAAATRDQALLEAQATLDEALLTASEKFKDQLNAINKEFKSVIKEMKGEVAGMASAISNLRSAISSARSEAASAAAAAAAASASSSAKAAAGAKVPFAKGGLVTGPTNALIGEAGPELVIPLDKFESWMNMGAGGGKALNYYAAPNQSLDSETELFNAMKRAKVVVGW
jgi:hypothetical protein